MDMYRRIIHLESWLRFLIGRECVPVFEGNDVCFWFNGPAIIPYYLHHTMMPTMMPESTAKLDEMWLNWDEYKCQR